MNRPPRYVRFLPELMRELYALPRWWVMLFTLLSFTPFAVMITTSDPFANGNGLMGAYQQEYYLFLHIGTLIGAVILGSIGGARMVMDLAHDPVARRRLSLWGLIDRILASCVHVYLFMLAAVPGVALILFLAPDNALRWDILRSLLWIESAFLFTACLVFVLSALTRAGWRVAAASELFPVSYVSLFFLMITVFNMFYGRYMSSLAFVPLKEFSHLDNDISILPRFISDSWQAELWLAGLLQQIAIGIAFLFFVRDVLRTQRGMLIQRSTYFIMVAVFAWISALDLWASQNMASGLSDYLVWAGIAILLSPLFVTPGHEQLRVRDLFLQNLPRRKQLCSPYAAAYMTILIGTLIFTIPIILGLFDKHYGLDGARVITLKAGIVLSLFYVWAGFLTALVEHCSLYVRTRGRTLALMVGLLFLLAPLFVIDGVVASGQREVYMQALSPFGWLRVDVSSFAAGDLTVYFGQLAVVTVAAFGLQLWTDHQRHKVDKAQRARINDALGLSAVSTALRHDLPHEN